jgi:DNA-binding NarL/FixJ family response regulator
MNGDQVELTRREREILSLVARGKSNLEIAESLDIALSTVRGHLSATYRKLEVSTRTQAVLAMLRVERRSLGPALLSGSEAGDGGKDVDVIER